MSDDDLFDSPGADGELPKDQWGRYKLPHPETGKVAGHTRVTTFAKSIADTYALSMWQQRMAIKGLTMRRDLYAMVAATSIEDRDKLNQLAEDAKTAASARAAANLGTAFHAFAEGLDTTGDFPTDIPADLAPILRARQAALAEHRIQLVPHMIERTVFVPRFGIVGTFDRWGRVGVPHPSDTSDPGEILDDKTGRDLTYGWNEIAIQLAAYANASHVLNKEIFWEDWNRLTKGLRAGAAPKTMPTRCWEPMPPTRTDRAIVIHAPVAQASDSPTALPVVTMYQVDIQTGWEAAQLCYDVREWRKRKGLAVPLTVTVPVVHGIPGVLASQNPGKSALVAAVQGSLDKAADQAGVDLVAAARAELARAEQVLTTSNVPDGVAADAIAQASRAAAVIESAKARPVRPAGTGCCEGWIGPDGPERCSECPAPESWHPSRLDEAPPADIAAERMVTRPPTWEERIFGATQLADLSQIWREATRAGEWTPELERLGKTKATEFHTL